MTRVPVAGLMGAVERACAPPSDLRQLRLDLLAVLRDRIGYDAYAWLLTDPATTVGHAPIAAVPWLSEVPRHIRLKYTTRINRWTTMGNPPARGLVAATGGDLAQAPLWRDLLADHGVTDALSVVFQDRFGCWGFLELWRMGGEFRAAEIEALAAASGPITAALRRGVAGALQPVPLTPAGDPVAAEPAQVDEGPVVLILSPSLEVRGQTPAAEAVLRTLVPPAGDRAAIPAGAYNVAAQLLAVEAGVDAHPPSARTHLSGGHWLNLRADRIGARGPNGEPDIAVSVEPVRPADRRELFGRAIGLTAREVEVLDRVTEGLDRRAVARTLGLSEYTVQDHLKAIFAKAEVNSRAELVAHATGR